MSPNFRILKSPLRRRFPSFLDDELLTSLRITGVQRKIINFYSYRKCDFSTSIFFRTNSLLENEETTSAWHDVFIHSKVSLKF